MSPYNFITVQSKPVPISEIEDALSPTSLAIAAELRLATSAPHLLRALQHIATVGGTQQAVFARSVLSGLGFEAQPLTPVSAP
jgi:hypothetical protein